MTSPAQTTGPIYPIIYLNWVDKAGWVCSPFQPPRLSPPQCPRPWLNPSCHSSSRRGCQPDPHTHIALCVSLWHTASSTPASIRKDIYAAKSVPIKHTFIISFDICCIVCMSWGVLIKSFTIVMISVLLDNVPATLASPSCSVSCEFMEMKCALLMYSLDMACTSASHQVSNSSKRTV